MKINLRIKTTLFFSTFLSIFSLSTVAMPCGKVPFYCVLVKNVEMTQVDKNNYYLAEEAISCSQTEYKIGNALPLCRVSTYENFYMYEACRSKYGSINTVGVVYYKGGDPVNPFKDSDKRMYGSFYRTSTIYREPKVAINFVKLLSTIKSTSCDLVTK